ncbi:MarR family winged helix-turn-helix transcriptional regulator [Acidocella sp. KAb 2-4]|uniref:MarR family winged helix-turn-helix transcriptional regulator n=1 Tax=Acidocella sp. KAb 2-4 TaxID=2885158 RepID=UPI001D08BFA9|nr:MarR family transcriptional regulator [Acidocella sp. KAb 2-4]MCB5945413.1 MarR family transcriptional regulator [Acidocella sp. KAb 2-4]
MSVEFERDLFFLMHDVARLTRVEADKRARVNGMTRAQWGILLYLSRTPGISQKELADTMEVEPITVARLVDRLEAAGLVERRADEQDRRIWRLHLRDSATGMISDITHQRNELAGLITQGVPGPVREAMIEGLTRMKTNLLRMTHPGAAKAPAGKPAKEEA